MNDSTSGGRDAAQDDDLIFLSGPQELLPGDREALVRRGYVVVLTRPVVSALVVSSLASASADEIERFP